MIQVVTAVIEAADGRLLACQRPDGKSLAGKWEFPGGKIEPGESPGDALLRELKEELGITVEITGALTSVPWDYGTFAIELHPFTCRLTGGEPQALEHREIRWCGRDELQSLDWAAADVPILQEWLQTSGPQDPA
jgi:8-oxo-dGTP diphosphatase